MTSENLAQDRRHVRAVRPPTTPAGRQETPH